MGLALIIFLRVLFIASMVLILGYVFGPFSKSPVLTRFTKIAAVLLIVLFVLTNILFFRFGRWNGNSKDNQCHYSNNEHLENNKQ